MMRTTILALVAAAVAIFWPGTARPSPLGEAKFIGAGPERGSRPALVLKAFVNEKPIARAVWRTTGLGVYSPMVNGREASGGKVLLEPGYTHPTKRRQEAEWDVTGLLYTDAGAVNCLAAYATSGWWCDGIVARVGGTWPAFRGVLEIEHADGSRATIATDESWKVVADTPIETAGIWEGMVVDVSKKAAFEAALAAAIGDLIQQDLQNPKESSKSELADSVDSCTDSVNPVRSAVVNNEFHGEVTPRIGPPIVLRLDKASDEIPFELAPGETKVIDFGQNCAAIPHFRFVSGAAGTKFECRLGEMLNDGIPGHRGDGPAGSVYLANMRGAKAGIDYTFGSDATEAAPEATISDLISQDKQNPEESTKSERADSVDFGADSVNPVKYADFTANLTFFGYRYASLKADGPVKGIVRSLPVSSVSREMEHGTVETGVPDVNRLVQNAYWGMLSNYVSIPTDCPQRNERLGWTGDTQVFAKTGAYFADIRGFMRKWMQDVRDTQHPDGVVPYVVPKALFGENGPIAGWSDCAVIVPWTMWKYLGDETIVRENWDAMCRYVAAVAKNDYTVGRVWLLCDWLSFENLSVDQSKRWGNGSYTEAHLDYQNFLNACYLLWDVRLMREMQEKCGIEGNSCDFAAIEARTTERILKTWFTPEGELSERFAGMQTPAIYALKLGLGDREKIGRALAKAVRDNGNRLSTGFLGTPFLLEELCNAGETELAYSVLLNHDFPGWLYPIDQGATTCWERWNSYTKEHGFGDVRMNSFNHYAYGAVVAWLFETAGGLKPGPDGGWKTFTIAPKPDRRLGHCRVEFDGGYGKIVSEWTYDTPDGSLKFTYSIPPGTTATVIDPTVAAPEATISDLISQDKQNPKESTKSERADSVDSGTDSVNPVKSAGALLP